MNVIFLFLIIYLATLMSLNANPKLFLIETADDSDKNSTNIYAETSDIEAINTSTISIKTDNTSEMTSMEKKGRSRKVSKGKCDANWLNEYQGYRPSDKSKIDYIIGGTMVNDWKEWPWMAALNTNDNDDIIRCGGALISCQHVITALHCIADYSTNKTYPPGNVEIFLGTTNVRGEGGTKFGAAKIFHKKDQRGKIEFYPGTQDERDDIAVIKLNRPINPYTRKDKGIRPIMLPKRALRKDDHYWFAGWGDIGYNFTMHSFIETDTLYHTGKIPPINSTNRCSSDPEFNAKRNICLKLTWNVTTCKGDSGSPGMISDEKSRWYLEGIESAGIGDCYEISSFGVQMNVMYYKKEIKKWIAK